MSSDPSKAASTAPRTALNNGVNGAVPKAHFSSIPSCIEAFRNGEFLIVLDDNSRENEGDLIISAAHLTPALSAFMIRHTSGYLCAPMSPERAAALNLPPMVAPTNNADPNRTAYTITVDASGRGVGTGISSADRALTSNVLADPTARPDDLRRPGHIVPLIAKPGGVRERRGHTEAAWEFAVLAGIRPEVAIIGEMVVDGEYAPGGQPELHGSGMMRSEDCLEFGLRWGIRCCTIADMADYMEETYGRL